MAEFKFNIDQINQKTFSDKAKVEEIQKRLQIDSYNPKQGIDEQDANLKLTATNTQTLDHYESYAFLQPIYVQKLIKWLKKGRHVHQILPSGKIELKLKIFSFELEKVQKSDIEVLKEEVCNMRKENKTLMGKLKMFRYYYFKYWNDKAARAVLEDKPSLKNNLIEDATNLYDIVEGSGVIKEEYGSKVYNLMFKKKLKQTPMAGFTSKLDLLEDEETVIDKLMKLAENQDQDGLSVMDEDSYDGSPITRASPSSEPSKPLSKRSELDIFVDGGLFNYHKAKLITKYIAPSETDSRAFMIRVNQQVEPGQKYTVYIPKRF